MDTSRPLKVEQNLDRILIFTLPAIYVEVGIAGQIDRPFLAQTVGTKGAAQRTRTLKAYVRRGGSPVTATPIDHLPYVDGFTSRSPNHACQRSPEPEMVVKQAVIPRYGLQSAL
jgi:hypothetical protein